MKKSRKKYKAKHIISFLLAFVLAFGMMSETRLEVYAASAIQFDGAMNASQLAASLLGSGLTAKNATSTGRVRSFSNGSGEIGINSGISLDTSGSVEGTNDKDLEKLITSSGNSYGGHTSTLQFELTATGTLLNFNYTFASCEFNQDPRFNDIFGLFVSVNDGPFENIALLDNGKPVTITNLKNGEAQSTVNGNQYYYKTASKLSFISDGSIHGVSYKLTAQKSVKKGDKVVVKFAIADVGDAGYDSYVFIEAGSLSFDAPGAKPNYENETLDDLTPNATYVVSSENKTYEIVANTEGRIPLSGTDKSGKSYNFIGKQISIYQKGDGTTGDSETKDVDVADRPTDPSEPHAPTNTPEDIDKDDILTTNNSIHVKAVAGQEYRIGEDGTWQSPGASGTVDFTGLEALKEYTIYTRVKATDEAPASLPSDGVQVTTRGMFETLTKTEYEGSYDGNSHELKVETDVPGATITYSDKPDGTYGPDTFSFKNSGEHTVYYCISKANYYNAYGTLTAKITNDKHILEYAADGNKITAKCLDEACEYNKNGVSLTLYADTQIYSGNDVTASYGSGETELWYTVTGTEAPAITYEYKATPDDAYAGTTETKNAGYYRASVTVNGKKASVEFEITKKPLTQSDVTLESDSFLVAADGVTKQAPVVTVCSDEIVLTKNKDYTLSGDVSAVLSGNYTITVKGKGNYTGTLNKSWKIEKNEQVLERPTVSENGILATQVIVDSYTGGAGDVEYAVSSKDELPATGWQTSNVFSGLTPEATFYVFVRCNGDAVYKAATSEGTAFTTHAIANVDVKDVAEADGIANPGITYDGKPVAIEDIIKGTPDIDEKPFTTTYKYVNAETGEELASAPVDAGAYKLIIDVKSANSSATKEIAFRIKNAEQPVVESETIGTTPTGIYGKKDGKITGCSSEYEYSIDGGDTYISCNGKEISGLAAGTVKIRKKAKPNFDPSTPIEVVIQEGEKIKLQVSNTKNCEITATPSAVAYGEDTTIVVKPMTGYKIVEPLKAMIGGVERTFVKGNDGNYICVVTNAKNKDALKITDVKGVEEKKHEDVTTVSGSVKDITDQADAIAEPNVFEAGIKNETGLEELLNITPEQKKQGVNVWLEVVDASETVSVSDKEQVENAKNDFNVGMILDVSLFKKIGDMGAEKISQTNGMTKISVLVPEDLRRNGRMYAIVRVHDGESTVILPALDANTFTLTFETDRFSTYAIVYKDSTPETAVVNKPGVTQTVSNKADTPATGDSFDPVIWLAVMGVAFLAILGLLNKRYKDSREEDDKTQK